MREEQRASRKSPQQDSQPSRSRPDVGGDLVLSRLHRALREKLERCDAGDLSSDRMLRVCAANTKVGFNRAIFERVEADDCESAPRSQRSGAVPQQIAKSRQLIIYNHAQRLDYLQRGGGVKHE